MTKSSNSLKHLREIILKLIGNVKIEESELVIVHKYLFNLNEPYYLSYDTDLYEAASHIKHIVNRNNVSSIDELIVYYDLKKHKARMFMQEAIANTRESDSENSDVTVLSVVHDDVSLKNVRLWQTYMDCEPDVSESLPTATCTILLLYDLVFKYAIDKATKLDDRPSEFDSLDVCLKSKTDELELDKTNSSALLYYFSSLFNKKMKGLQILDGWKVNHSNIENFTFNRLKFDQELNNLFKVHQPITNEETKLKIIKWIFYSKLKYPRFRKYFFPILSKRVRLNPFYKNCGIKKKRLFPMNDIDSFISDIYSKRLAPKKWLILKSPKGHSWNISENVGVSINIKDIEKGLDCLNMEFSPKAYKKRHNLIYSLISIVLPENCTVDVRR